jgi:hypothetical protein
MLEGLGFYAELAKQKIQWHWKFGVNGADYIIVYESKPIPEKYFKGIYDLMIKKKTKLPYEFVTTGRVFDVNANLDNDLRNKVIALFPRTTIKGEVFLSKNLSMLEVRKVDDGWIVAGSVTGLRKWIQE